MNSNLVNILRGQDTSQVISHDLLQSPLHEEVVGPLLKLREASIQAGHELAVVSGFRSFERQLTIWNEKASGKRVLNDSLGTPLDFDSLSEEEIVYAILRWSAFPGASRHHWGTDFDIYDKSAMTEGYEIQLSPQEVSPEGIFGPMHLWLDEILSDGTYPFYRPYSEDRGGVAPEKWHLSYIPLSEDYSRAYDYDFFEKTVKESPALLKEIVLDNCREIYERFIMCPYSTD